MLRPCLGVFGIVLAGGLPVWGQDRPCPEFGVTAQTIGNQRAPAVASRPDGTFVVVWESGNGLDPSAIVARRFAASGAPLGGDFRVNTHTTGQQARPDVALDAGGNMVMVWDSQGQDGSEFGVFGQRYDASGNPLGGEFQVNSYTTGAQVGPAVAAGQDGFVVAWDSVGQDGQGHGIFARRYDATGAALGPEFQVNTYTTGNQTYPAVSVDASGAFVVVWHSVFQEGRVSEVYGQRFGPDGRGLGGEFRINVQTMLDQAYVRVAHGPNGDFLAVWTSIQDGDFYGIFGRRFDSSGVAQGSEFQINTYTTDIQDQPIVAGDPSGGFVVVWDSHGQDGSGYGVFGRRLAPNGAPIGPEFAVNSFTTGNQDRPAVAALPNGGFVAVWESAPQEAGGVYASLDCAHFYPLTPCRVVDTRGPAGPGGGPPLAAHASRAFPITGACSVPADARAVALNVTAVNPGDAGDLRLFPTGQASPNASALNFAPGRTRANSAVMPLGAGGQVTVQCDMPPGSPGSVNLVLDVLGYLKR